ncbi:hypothetical protein KY290_024325 [Solanum tuberosum]|uniref:Uncharacterized protein n=1 Tax=Solanum tuberosum TaxID=4113 RepID=A0ABQ7UQE9_SOLTU|nr:hypothetical protein KY290_024325 [Solanum tuberosum]
MQRERGTHLVSYNPKEEMLRKVVNVYGSGTEATRYIPSFYSLKTVMGDKFSSLKCLSEDSDSLEYFFCLTPSRI